MKRICLMVIKNLVMVPTRRSSDLETVLLCLEPKADTG